MALSAAVRSDMSAAGLLAPAPAPAGAPPAPEYYPEEDEELESAEDDERSCRGRESDEGMSFSSLGSTRRGWNPCGSGWDSAWERGGATSGAWGRLEGQLDGARLREVNPHLCGQRDALGVLFATVTGRKDVGSCCPSCPLSVYLRSALFG